MPSLVARLLDAHLDNGLQELPRQLFTSGLPTLAFAQLAQHLGLLNEQERAAYDLLVRAKDRLKAERTARGRLLEDYL